MTETPSPKDESGYRETETIRPDDKAMQRPIPRRTAKQTGVVCMACGKPVGKRDRICPHCGADLDLG
jgi:rRNA maturation endonuclease Nob1